MVKDNAIRNKLTTGLIFAVSCFFLVTGLYRHGILGTGRELVYGKYLEECQLTEDVRSHIRKGSWYFVIVGTLEDEAALLKYLESLLSTPQLRTGNLTTIGLIDGHGENFNIQRFTEANNLSYPILPLHDISATDLAKLGIADHGRLYLLINPNLQIEFVAKFMKTKDLRLLMEKYFDSKLSGHAGGTPPLMAGDIFSPPSPKSLSSDQANFDPRSRLLVIFTSGCVSCMLHGRLAEVALHQEILVGSAAMDNLEVSILFSPSFVANDAMLRMAEVGLKLPGYIASELPGIEDPYSRQPLHDWEIVVIKTDEDGRVLQVAPWDGYLDSMLNG